MLDPRLYRAALVPVLIAVLIAAFSLEDRPRPVGTTLAPDAFQGPRTTQLLDQLATAYPRRAPGSSGDEALGRRIAQELRRLLEGGSVVVERAGGRTSEGREQLTTVLATRPGRPGPGLVVLAHRDAQGPQARAELSGTAAMLELARITGEGRTNRTTTFVSTSGGSDGAAGAIRAAERLQGEPVSAVLVLGDLASTRIRKPFVSGWSTARGQASLRLRRTVEAAVRAETSSDPGAPRLTEQWARLALPVTTGEQGPLLERGLPAVLMSVSGELGPRSDEPLAPGRLEVFGRAALRAFTALDNGPTVPRATTAAVVTQRKVLPAWAVRLLVGALLLPPLLAAVDGFARVRRRREPVGRWVGAVAVTAVPFVLVACVALGLMATGLGGGAPPSAPGPEALDVDGTALGTMAALALVLALAVLGLRPVLLRFAGARGPGRGTGGAAIGVLLVLCLTAIAVWVVNPHAAMLLVPALHVWLLALAPGTILRGRVAAALVLVSLLPVLALWAVHAEALELGPLETAWLGVLLVGGGQISLVTCLVWSILAACAVRAFDVAIRRPADDLPPAGEVTVRGPLSYAGPGSLGGTESALRR
ncbi:MAG TPA: hypothetical protein VD931_06440 [Baekduia sp.]|nr:hypothetical protein [Baekduia sp.]